jgi:hypothetical protein
MVITPFWTGTLPPFWAHFLPFLCSLLTPVTLALSLSL